MKGYIIYENDLGRVNAVELQHASFCHESVATDVTEMLEGTPVNCKSAKCDKSDAYDFEIGALISLMRACKFDKSYKAMNEAFNYNSILEKVKGVYTLDLEKQIEELKTENQELHKEICSYERGRRFIVRENNSLKEEVKRLAKEKEQIIVARSILYNRLEKENEKLKLDCEKLQHGYIDTDMIFCGGRQNGKQYTFLVELFKNIDKKKVEAAYKKAYNTDLPLWQKEILNQMYGIHKESKEKIEIQGFHIEVKPSTKREQMWNDILSCGDVGKSKFVNVKKENLSAFLKDAEAHGVYNLYGDKMSDSFKNLYLWDQSVFTFQILRKPAGFVASKYCYVNTKKCGTIEYLPPMRWDLFEKGRRIVRVTPENIDDFISKCSNKLGGIMKPVLIKHKEFTHIFIMISDYHYDNKPTLHIMSPEDLVRNQHENPKKYSDKKIVDWEDVR